MTDISRIEEEFAKWESQQYAGNSKEKRTKLAQYFTPAAFAKALIDKLGPLEDKDILDPCLGSGNLIAAAVLSGADPKRCYGIELDEAVLEVAKKRLAELGVPEANLVCGSVLEQSSYAKKFDCIVMNPPYKRGLHIDIAEACIPNLQDDGILLSLCPRNSLTKFKYFAPKMAKRVAKVCDYIESVEMIGFKAFDTVGLNVDFSIMACKHNPTTHYFDNFFESEVEKSLYKKVSSIYRRNKEVYTLWDGYNENIRKPKAYSAQVGLKSQLNGTLRCQITKDAPKNNTCIRYKPTPEQLAGKYWAPVRLLHRPSKLTTSLHNALLWLADGTPDKAKYFAVFSTQQELDNFKNSLSTYFYRWVYEYLTRLNNYNFVNTIPMFTDYTQPITDEVICGVYGFTDDEFALVKRQVEEAEANNIKLEEDK